MYDRTIFQNRSSAVATAWLQGAPKKLQQHNGNSEVSFGQPWVQASSRRAHPAQSHRKARESNKCYLKSQ